jgi:hypothetical protein
MVGKSQHQKIPTGWEWLIHQNARSIAGYNFSKNRDRMETRTCALQERGH